MKNAKTTTAQEILDNLENELFLKVGEAYVELHTRESVLAEQAAWHEDDLSKNVDFSRAPFWILSDGGYEAIYDDEDLNTFRDVYDNDNECGVFFFNIVSQ